MRRVVLLSIGIAASLALAGCSSASGAGTSSPTSVGSPAPRASSPGGPGGAGFPGVSGLVAEVTGSTAQVQTRTSQTAVTWTSRTRFTQQRATSAAALKVGDCVVAVSVPPTGTSPGGTPTPSATPSRTTSVAATSVEIRPATSGGCTGFGFGSGRGGGGGRTGASRPSGIPTPRRSFTARPRSGPRPGVAGSIAAVGSGSFTVRSARGAASQEATVTWSSSTRFTAQTPAAAAAVKVGVCLTAAGRTDDTGALTASAITLAPSVNGSCTRTGLFGRGGPRPTTSGAATLNG